MDLSKIEKEKMKAIVDKLGEYQQVVSDGVGRASEVVALMHVKHVKGDECEGVAILSENGLSLAQVHSLLMQAILMVDIRLMAEQAEMAPPGTKMN